MQVFGVLICAMARFVACVFLSLCTNVLVWCDVCREVELVDVILLPFVVCTSIVLGAGCSMCSTARHCPMLVVFSIGAVVMLCFYKLCLRAMLAFHPVCICCCLVWRCLDVVSDMCGDIAAAFVLVRALVF